MQTQLGLRFVLFPGPSSSGDQVLGEYTLSRWVSASYHLRGPSCSVSLISSRAPSQVFCVSPPESYLWPRPYWWMSTVQHLWKSWLATGSLFAVWYGVPSLGPRLPFSGSGCPASAFLPPAGNGRVCRLLALLWYSLSPLFCEQARLP